MTWTLVLAVISIQWKRSFHSHVTVALKGLSRLLRMFWRKREETHLARMGALQDVDYWDYWLFMCCFVWYNYSCLVLMYLSAWIQLEEYIIHLHKVSKCNKTQSCICPYKHFYHCAVLDLESIFAATYPKCQMSFPFCWWCLLAWWSESKTFRPSESITQSSELAKVFSCSQAQHRGYQSCQHTTMTTTATSKTCKLESLSFPPSAKM